MASTDLAALASDHGLAAALGGIVVLVAKELVGLVVSVSKELVARFLRRGEKLETKREDKLESLIDQLLSEVQGMRHSLAVWAERLTNHQASATETKERVDEHGGRISALEVGQVELRTRVEYLAGTGGKDD